jgi:hypothetical protein
MDRGGVASSQDNADLKNQHYQAIQQLTGGASDTKAAPFACRRDSAHSSEGISDMSLPKKFDCVLEVR